MSYDEALERFDPALGLEVHVELNTASKMWCGCPNEFCADPNTNVCPVCLGLPGVLPVANEEALRLTVLTGLLLAWVQDYLADALTFREPYQLIGTGMWLALIMAFNVWFIIWPNQKRALGLVEADDASKAKSARTAMLASRTNTLLSIPMLYAMTAFRY